MVQKVNCPLLYVNAVGGNDELIFDGSSIALSADGKTIGQAPSFEFSCSVIDLESGPAQVDEETALEMESIRQALVLGLRDYANKSGFKQGLIGLSGGIDSAVTAALAVEALGKENVIGISLPSAISSDHSRNDARSLAENLGISYHSLPIQKIVDSAENELAPLFTGMDTGRDGGKPPGPQSGSLTDGGVQQTGSPPPDHRKQKRAGGGILHPLRGYVRWTGSNFRPSKNHGLCSGPSLKPKWRNHSPKYH